MFLNLDTLTRRSAMPLVPPPVDEILLNAVYWPSRVLEVAAECRLFDSGQRVEYLVQASAKGTGYQTLLNSGPGPGSHAIKIIVVGRALSKNTHLATAGLPAPKLPSACQKAYFKTSEQVVSLHALPKSDFRRGKAVAFPQHENFRKYAQTTAVCKDVSAVS